MRIVNVIEDGRIAGPQMRMVVVSKELIGSAFTKIVMPCTRSYDFQVLCRKEGVLFCVLPLRNINKNWKEMVKYLFFFPYEVLCLARKIKNEKADIVHVSGGSWQYKGVLAAWLARVPSVWHLNDTSMPSFIRVAYGVLSRLASGFIFASIRSKEYYSFSSKSKTAINAVVPAPVDTDRFDPDKVYASDNELIREWVGRVVVGTVANVNPIKGIETLIRAASSPSLSGLDIQFVVVGPVFDTQVRYFGRLKEMLETLKIKNFSFVGGRSDVRALLKRFDIYVCSSNAESSPISVWEAMSMRKAIVSTDVGDVPVHIENAVSGFIVPVEGHEEMADRIATLIADPELRMEFGRRAREEAIRSFSPAVIAKKTLDVYKSVVKSVNKVDC